MSKAQVALKIVEVLLKWGGRLVEAVRSGDEKRVDDVLREQPRVEEEWARYGLAKEEKFGTG